MAFTPINTQEEFDAALKDRLSRQEQKIRAEYAEQEGKIREEYSDYEDLKKRSATWDAEKETLEKSIADSKKDYEDLNAKYTQATGRVAELETDALKVEVTIEKRLPVELKEYLKGTTKEEIEKSAERLAKFARGGQTPPLADPEGDPPKDRKKAAIRQMLKEMNGKGD